MSRTSIEQILETTMGLHAGSIGDVAVQRAIHERMRGLGVTSTDDYATVLQSSRAELQELIEVVVVPETWFFRDLQAFAALRDITLREWPPAHPAAELRVLSLPCATGEEPFSIAMTLVDAGFPAARVRIDAIDISHRVLVRARQAVYRESAFRTRDLDFRNRHFQQTANGYRLNDTIRTLVTFRQGNVLDPAAALELAQYDIIFCRNMLIYFDRPAQRHVLQVLEQHLQVGGYLFVGSAEAFWTLSDTLRSANYPMAFAYRKELSANPMQTAPAPSARKRRAAPPPAKRPRAERVLPPRPRRAPVAAEGNVAASTLEQAHELANSGRLAEAAAICEAYLARADANAGAYYLLGLVRDAQGSFADAASCYRRALYLEPAHPDAAMHLALLAEKQGDSTTAQRLLDRARRSASRDAV